MPRSTPPLLTLLFSLMLALGAWAQGAPEIVITELQTMIPNGKVYLEGYRAIGTTSIRVYGVQNAGTAPLTGLQLTAEGPDADFLTITHQPLQTVAAGGTTFFRALLSPSRAGPYTARLRLTSNDVDNNPFDLTYSGTGTTTDPDVRVERPVGTERENGATQSFSTVSQGGSLSLNFRLINAGGSTLSNLAASITGEHASDYAITQGPGSQVLLNSYATFTVRFTPSAPGVRNATLSIVSNDPDENPFVLNLTGTGGSSPPNLSLEQPADTPLANNSTTDFGTVTTPLSRTFTLRNTGTNSLLSTVATIAGTHASDFVITQAPATSLAGHTTSICTVRFAPSAPGVRNATLSISSNDPDGNPFVLNLTGTGGSSPPNLSLEHPTNTPLANNSTTDFGTVTTPLSRSFTLRNTGTNSLLSTVATIAGTHASDFVITQAPATSLPGNTTSICTVRFAPSAPGIRNATLSISSNDPDGNPFVLQLTGMLAMPEITVTEATERVLQSGDKSFWGPVAIGSEMRRSFTITNTGLSPLTGLSATISGLHASEYTLSGQPATSLAPSDSATFYVTLTPMGPGERQAALAIASNDVDENPFVIQLAASGPAPDIRVEQPVGMTLPDGDSRSFGKVHLAGSMSLEFTVRNAGFQPLTGLSFSKTGAHANDFVITQAAPITQLEPYTSTTFMVTFTPGGVGTRTAALHISSNDPDESPYDIQLSGEGIQPHLVLEDANASAVPSGTLVDFGSVAFGQTGRRDYTLRNTGTTPLIVSGTNWSNSRVYSFDHSLPGQVQIQPGASQAFSVFFEPLSFGQYSNTLRILSNDVEASPFELQLTGLGLRPGFVLEQPPGVIAGSNYEFGAHELGTKTELVFAIKNVGNVPLTYSMVRSGLHANDYTVPQIPQNPLAPGQSTEFKVIFSPKAVGPRLAYIEITHDGGDDSSPSSWVGCSFRGSGRLSSVSLSTTSLTAFHGDTEAVVTLNRVPSVMPVTVQLDLTSGTAQAMPPIEPAIAGTDYTPLTGAAAEVSFAAGEAQKTVRIPLLALDSRAEINRRLNLTLSRPSSGAELVAPTTGRLTILARDSTPPTLKLSTPVAGKVVEAMQDTLIVSGRVGDAKGISSLTLKLNDTAPVPLPLGIYTSLTDMPFELMITPLVGPNEITLTAVDPRGNTTTLTRSFSFARLRTLTVRTQHVRTGGAVPAARITLGTWPASSATPLMPGTSGETGKVSMVKVGAPVTVTVTAPRDLTFHSWTPLEDSSEGQPLGNAFVITMPNRDLILEARLMPRENSRRPGKSVQLHCLLDSGLSPSRPDLMASLSGTLTPGGIFTGRFQILGKSQRIHALCYDHAPTVFTVGKRKMTSLPAPGGALTLQLQDEGELVAYYVKNSTQESSAGVTQQAPFSFVNKVPAGLLNSAAQGFYTLHLDPDSPVLAQSAYPQGHGYATARLAAAGHVSITGALPDGSSITCSSALLDDTTAPIYIPLRTPGSTNQGGLLFGTLVFRMVEPEAFISSTLQWFRPEAATPEVLLYPAGWPSGINLETQGTLYDRELKLQSMLGLGAVNSSQGNAALRFVGGKLTAEMVKNSFNIDKNTVIKIAPTDTSYTLSFSAATGLFSGTFTPNWSHPGPVKPSFRGIILQGTTEGPSTATGFFINNAKSETAPESGSVTLGAPLP